MWFGDESGRKLGVWPVDFAMAEVVWVVIDGKIGQMTMSTTTAQTGSQINPRLIVPFVNSVRDVFATMVKIPTTVERPYLKPNPCASYDVSAIVGFSGNIVGNVVVSFQLEAATKLVTAFAGAEVDAGSPDFADAVCELANMIAGAAKKDLGSEARISIPSVIIGAGHQVARLRDVPCMVVPCKTPVGDFAVEVSIREVGESGK
jgi:chemotaxis protein CheX